MEVLEAMRECELTWDDPSRSILQSGEREEREEENEMRSLLFMNILVD